MKRVIALTLLGVLVAVPTYAQKPNATEQEVLKASQAANDASLIKKDRATMERLYADDYMYLHSNGTVNNKTQEIAESMSPDQVWTAYKTDDSKVRIYRDVAVVTGLSTLTGSAKGYVSGPRRFTEVWVKRSGRWQMVGGQSTLVPSGVSSVPAPAAGMAAPMEMPVADVADMETRSSSAVTWTDLVVPGFPSGGKMAVIHGNPASKGDYTIRLQFPDGYQFPVHWHPGGEHVTVLSGTFRLGMGGTANASALRSYAPGDFVYIPARMSHFGGATGATVIQLHGMGPFAINLGTAQ